MKKIVSIMLLIPVLPLYAFPAETLYPAGYNLLSQYELSSQSLSPGDTLIITRSVINNELFPISGLYFSENFPAEFNLVEYSVTKNGSEITHLFDSTISSTFADNDCYYWIIDDPEGSVHNIINPGDNIVLIIKLTCSLTGIYSFPMHTGAFYGNSTGFFTTGDSLLINVSSTSDSIPPSRITDLDAL